ncbi:NAD-dependent epimerase/dehydratase family protein [Terrilactibacillus sp. BCM23-1]|uniref:NAD-dependent epimerase/dehydratase family protein n=1 Tax=Terrilactibacillus tamarindi TaxID=2599694 RepID=A0A6N8CP36_9BACI|nr:nucleoside-diphosphate sugar epimerase/dehydratase [Terrilactibacillus tamarindi]MTT30907.1 NAD-dependent epimerase/dehydratase family protein [Terrilactibacillus tamarindi]
MKNRARFSILDKTLLTGSGLLSLLLSRLGRHPTRLQTKGKNSGDVELDMNKLLGRAMIKPTQRINDYLTNKTILITGAGGSIGSELVKQVASFTPKCVVLLGHGENSIFNIKQTLDQKYPQIKFHYVIADIQDKPHLDYIFQQYKPEIVFHAAAHKHVPLMEMNIGAAVRNNIFGTDNLVKIAAKYHVERFVFISTDKAVYPVNTMGLTKRIGELLVQTMAERSKTKFSVVRFGNVLESRGSVIPIFKQQIASGGPVTVTHPDMVRYFMTIPEAVLLVLEAGALSKGGEVFVLDMGKPVKIVDLAKNLIEQSGYRLDKDIKMAFTGIRPGEKLNEVLFYETEKIKKTDHPHVVIAIPNKNKSLNIDEALESIRACLLDSPEQLHDMLISIVEKAGQ